MTIIKGYVVQIIPPDKLNQYCERGWKEPFIEGKYSVIIDSVEYHNTKGYFRRLYYRIKHRHKKYWWALALDKVGFSVGEYVNLNCKRYIVKTDLYIIK